MVAYLLEGATGTGAGSSYRVGDGHRIQFLHRFTIQSFWTISAGESITALSMKIWGSLDNSHFGSYPLAEYTADATDLTAKECMFHVTFKPINYLKAEITTLTKSGGTASVTVMVSPAFLRSL